MFGLELVYLTGRAVATAYNDRNVAEWPPHPARLFSALVATWADGGDPPDDAERAALVWLENQGPPWISAPSASLRGVLPTFVPVNDTTVLGDMSRYHDKVAEAEQALLSGEKGATKVLAKAKEALTQSEARATAVSPTPSGKDYKTARQIFPDGRPKQARTFPSVGLDQEATQTTPEPVIFGWPDADPGVHKPAMERLVSRLVRVGHSSSLVRCRMTFEDRKPDWVPSAERHAGAKILRVVSPGQLDRLVADFERHQGFNSRVMPCSFQSYTKPEDVNDPSKYPATYFGPNDTDWIVLAHRTTPHVSTTRTVDLASAIRTELLRCGALPAPEILSGHGPDGQPSTRPHVAIVPLPWVGSQYATGDILGIALILPRECSEEDRVAVQTSVGQWLSVVESDDSYSAKVSLRPGPELSLELVLEEPHRFTLRPKTWVRAATTWLSATPIALDRNPGDLFSADPGQQSQAYRNAEQIIAQSCVNIGLPIPHRVDVLPSVSMIGTVKARHYPPFPVAPHRPRRVKVHAAIEFEEPVMGPLLIGAGRYLGLGLMRPV
ncbi:MAG: type I-U CRISPR-associated protein Cas5/Cas6 [Myxococcales bacterium]|nr:type I-U CRISPR-associated protein Cas5/Cas6 [Myxococcales bacterium]